ncbi:hypothetical protein FHX80_13186 [Streptomyces brevispora]|uniref:Uncharacterized protein n=1 Tax=Streptomyces brevispora TaxID=887462 RepID=A0A561TUH8_9ACTN|nr:hypothetical protein FHX80_13186 [Streptomyces brevispora]
MPDPFLDKAEPRPEIRHAGGGGIGDRGVVGPGIVPDIGPAVGPGIVPDIGPAVGPGIVPDIGPAVGLRRDGRFGVRSNHGFESGLGVGLSHGFNDGLGGVCHGWRSPRRRRAGAGRRSRGPAKPSGPASLVPV